MCNREGATVRGNITGRQHQKDTQIYQCGPNKTSNEAYIIDTSRNIERDFIFTMSEISFFFFTSTEKGKNQYIQ